MPRTKISYAVESTPGTAKAPIFSQGSRVEGIGGIGVGTVLGQSVYVNQWWTPVKWDEHDDPDWFKSSCLQVITAEQHRLSICRGLAARAWVHKTTEHKVLDVDLCEEFAKILQRVADAGEMLWTVVANVSGGDWKKQSEEWQQAAARYRDEFFDSIGLGRPNPALRCSKLSAPTGESYITEGEAEAFTMSRQEKERKHRGRVYTMADRTTWTLKQLRHELVTPSRDLKMIFKKKHREGGRVIRATEGELLVRWPGDPGPEKWKASHLVVISDEVHRD